MTTITLAGSTGWVGAALVDAVNEAIDLELVAGVSRSTAGQSVNGIPIFPTVEEALSVPSDVLIDYTTPDTVKANVLAAISTGRHVVVGTSGLTGDDYLQIDAAARTAGVGVVAAGNFSITATLLQRFALEAIKYVPDVEVIDYASASKPDTPSGTGRELAETLAASRMSATSTPVAELQGIPETRGGAVGVPRSVQVHSIRMPGFVRSAEAVFGLADERLVIRHDAGSSAAPYVAGTLLAARRVADQVGLRRGLDSVMTDTQASWRRRLSGGSVSVLSAGVLFRLCVLRSRMAK